MDDSSLQSVENRLTEIENKIFGQFDKDHVYPKVRFWWILTGSVILFILFLFQYSAGAFYGWYYAEGMHSNF